MSAFADLVRFLPVAGGTTDWVVSSAVGGCQLPSAANVVNGVSFKFYAVSTDLTQWELTTGTYNSGTTTFARTTVLYNSLGTTAKVNFTTIPQVSIVAIVEDLIPAQAAFGLGMINGTLVASVATNILTVAIKTFSGNDPSAADPVFFYFRDATAATGDYTWRSVTAALSITTFATGATLGTANTAPFRLWVHAFDNAGTVVLALYQSVTGGASPTALTGWNEAIPVTTVAMSGSATAAATFYTPNGTTLTTKSFVPLGYLDYASGLTTAGTYASGPTTIQLFRRGIKKPGDIVQSAYVTSTATTTGNGASAQVTGLSKAIAPTFSPNLISAMAFGEISATASSVNCAVAIQRGSSTTISNGATYVETVGAGTTDVPASMMGLDAPGTTSSTTYAVWLQSTGATTVWLRNNNLSTMRIDELMV